MSTLQLAASFEAIDDALKSTKTVSIKEATGPTRYAAYSGTGDKQICRKKRQEAIREKESQSSLGEALATITQDDKRIREKMGREMILDK